MVVSGEVVVGGVQGVMVSLVHFGVVGWGIGSGETVHFTLPNCQGGIAPEALRFASWSMTQLESRLLSAGVSGRS